MAGGHVGDYRYLRSTELLSATASAWEAGQDLPDRGLYYPASVSLDKAVVILGKGRHQKKNYLDRDIVPTSSDPPTYETDRDNLDGAADLVTGYFTTGNSITPYSVTPYSITRKFNHRENSSPCPFRPPANFATLPISPPCQFRPWLGPWNPL